MPLSQPAREIRRLGSMPRIGAIVLAEEAVDRHLDDIPRRDERILALDILRGDLARMRGLEPSLDGFIDEVERYIDLLNRDLLDRARLDGDLARRAA